MVELFPPPIDNSAQPPEPSSHGPQGAEGAEYDRDEVGHYCHEGAYHAHKRAHTRLLDGPGSRWRA